LQLPVEAVPELPVVELLDLEMGSSDIAVGELEVDRPTPEVTLGVDDDVVGSAVVAGDPVEDELGCELGLILAAVPE